jgi:c-di-GMP-binding flagellar brake protein YcgR
MPKIERAKEVDRRRDFRVHLMLRVRVRTVSRAEDPTTDLVEQYEVLGQAAQRYRRDCSPPGRQFVDQLMGVIDKLTAMASESGSNHLWSPRVVVEVDISVGGMGFISTSNFEPGSTVTIEFALPDDVSQVPFRCDALVLRCCPESTGMYNVGFEFGTLNSATQERLMRSLFEIQRRRLRDRRVEA